MNKKIIIIILIIAFVLLLAGAGILYNRLGQQVAPDQLVTEPSTEPATVPSGTEEPQLSIMPDFTVYDTQGNPVQLHDYFGKPIVLNFWASWCGPCKSEMPDFQEKYELMGQDIQFLMVNMTDGSRETVEAASAFIAQQGYTFPVLYDSDSDAAATYGVYSLPTTYFLDAQGNGVAYATGAITADMLQQGIDMIS